MASYFDQFRPEADSDETVTGSQQSGSYFDQFKSAEAAPDPENDSGILSDAAMGFGRGANQLLSGVGTLYGLVTGDYDNFAKRQGDSGVEYFNDRMSDDYEAAAQRRSKAIEEADGELEKAGAFLWETVRDPTLLTTTLTEQIPMLLAPGGVGMAGARAGAAGARALGQSAAAAAKTGGKVGTGAGVAAGGALNSADAVDTARTELLKLPPEVWMKNPDYAAMVNDNVDPEIAKNQIAQEISRDTAATSFLLSLATQKLVPGGRTFERGAAGEATELTGNAVTRAIKGGAGESLQEGLEESVASQLPANIGIKRVDETQSLTEGLGESFAAGALVSGPIGAITGATSKAQDEAINDITDEEAAAEVRALQEEARAKATREDVAASQAALEVEQAGGDALDATVAAQAAYNAEAEARQIEEREQAAAEAEIERLRTLGSGEQLQTNMDPELDQEAQAAREDTPLQQSIDRARARGDEQSTIRLENARRMFETADRFEREGRVQQAENFRARAQKIVSDVDGSTGVVPRVAQGELQVAEQVTPTAAPEREPVTIDQRQPALPQTTAPGQAAINVPPTPEQQQQRDDARRADEVAREGVIPRGEPGRMQAPIVEEGEVITDRDFPPVATEAEEITDANYTIPQDSGRDLPSGPSPVGADRANTGAATDVEPGYERFNEPTLGIPRQQMPQIKSGDRSALVQFLEARGVGNLRETLPAADLLPTQTNYSPEKVAAQRENKSSRAVIVSREGRIIDGHHQWLAAREAGEDIDVIRLDTTAEDALSLALDFPSSTTESAGTDLAPDAESTENTGNVTENDGNDAVEEGGASYSRANDEAGGYKIRKEKTGSIAIMGDPEEIRSKLPDYLKGRKISGGLAFTAANAPAAMNALSGTGRTQGRAGEVRRHEIRNGKYVGASEAYNTPGKIRKLRKWLRTMAEEGERGRYWYEKSSRGILEFVGGDVREAKKLLALMSIYSPQATVAANTNFALRAYAQHRAGQPISIKQASMDKKANEAMADPEGFVARWKGEKTGNFYHNLLAEIDSSIEQGATIDIWMMRAGAYDGKDAPTAAQYAFMEVEVNRIAQDLGWPPHQAQAAIWTGMKARWENAGVKTDTEFASEKKGYIEFRKDGEVVPKGTKKAERVVLDKGKHFQNWREHAEKHDPTAEDTSVAAFDFADAVRNHMGIVSWEPIPGGDSVLQDLNEDQQAEFASEIYDALTDDAGVDMLARELGLLVDDGIFGAGAWEGESNVSRQQNVVMAPEKGSTLEIAPDQRALVETYAASLGLLMKQDSVGYHRPSYRSTKKDSNAIEFRAGRPLTKEEMLSLEAALSEEMANSPALVVSAEGVRVINFSGDNNAFADAAVRAYNNSSAPDAPATRFATDGDLVSNDWSTDTDGQGYESVIREAGRPDILEWIRDVLEPRVQPVIQRYEQIAEGQQDSVQERAPQYQSEVEGAYGAESEERPGTRPEQRSAGRSALRDLLRRFNATVERSGGDTAQDGPGAELLASRLSANFVASKPNRLIGETVNGPKDLAALAQVYRDPRFETLRLVFTSGDTAVGETAFSSRMPGSVEFHGGFDWEGMKSRMQALGADGFYLLHNHPSGNSSPSDADVKFTQKAADKIPGFRGHVVIDFNEYSTIDADGSQNTISEDMDAEDFYANPEMESDLLGHKISGLPALRAYAKAFADPDRAVFIITNSRNEVQIATSISPDTLAALESPGISQARVSAMLRAMLREAGAGGLAFMVMPENGVNDNLLSDTHPIRRIVTDIVDGSGSYSLAADGPLARIDRLFSRNATVAEGDMDRLIGLPDTVDVDGRAVPFKNFAPAVDAARKYMESKGMEYNELERYVPLNRSLAPKIASAFDAMEHRPNDPEVKAAYDAMIEETMDQYRAILDTGLSVHFIKGDDPYGNPRNAVLDVIENNQFFVFPTSDGFGTDEDFDASENPLLRETEFKTEDGDTMLANDVFRVVHDYFGHVKNGVGFRARGEENAWQSHASMYSPLARRAMTVETRGQNSWVNFGPHGEYNRTAGPADTIYADQKIGLLPNWVSEYGRDSERDRRDDPRYKAGLQGAIDRDGVVSLSHFSHGPVEATDPGRAGTGLDRKVSGRRQLSQGTWFGITKAEAAPYKKESGLGSHETEFVLPATSLYPANADPEGLWVRGDIEATNKNLKEAGFSGWWANNKALGKVAFVFEPVYANREISVQEPGAEYQPEQPKARLYQKIVRLVEEANIPGLKPSKRNPEGGVLGSQWLNYLRARGVKQEEWQWTGMRDLLNENSKVRFTRQEMRLLAESKSVGIKTIVAGNQGQKAAPVNIEMPDGMMGPSDILKSDDERALDGVTMDLLDSLRSKFDDESREIINEEFVNNFSDDGEMDAPNALPYWETSPGVRIIGSVNAGQYSVWTKVEDSSEGFVWELREREIYGISEAAVVARALTSAGEDAQQEEAQWGEFVEDGEFSEYHELKIQLQDTAELFSYTAHFNEPNLLGFVRADMRQEKGRIGETYFIEEIQSDWHQQGRQRGYRSDDDSYEESRIAAKTAVTYQRAARELKQRSVSKFHDSVIEAAALEKIKRGEDSDKAREDAAWSVDALIDDRTFNLIEVDDSSPEAAEKSALEELDRVAKALEIEVTPDLVFGAKAVAQDTAEWKRAYRERMDASEAFSRVSNMPPDAPFKDDAWMTLLAKRALIEAVNRGASRVAWPTGKQIEKRWSSEFAELYDQTYNKKLPGVIRRLIGSEPKLVRRQEYGPSSFGAKAGDLMAYNAESHNWRTMDDLMDFNGRTFDASNRQDAMDAVREWAGSQISRSSRDAEGWSIVTVEELIDQHYSTEKWEADITPATRTMIEESGYSVFREGGTTAAGMTVEAVEKAIGGAQPGVKVVQTMEDLPSHIKLQMKRQGVTGIRGYYNRESQQVVLVASSLKNAKDAQVTLVHETIGHRGIENVFGESLNEFYAMVRQSRNVDPVIREAYDFVDRAYPDASDFVKAAEVVAKISESNPKHGLVQRVMQWMRQALRNLGITIPFSNNDIVEALRRARTFEQGYGNPGPATFFSVANRSPEMQDQVARLERGEITNEEYAEEVKRILPVTPLDSVPSPATQADMERALHSNKLPKMTANPESIPDGTLVGARLDIPAYDDHGVWVVTLHDGDGTKTGKPIAYTPTAVLTNVEFTTSPKAALNIAKGKPKATIARMHGTYKAAPVENARRRAQLAMKNPAWVQVGMNPERHSFFYDKADNRPVVSAEEVIQVGALVMAKNPVYGDPMDEQFRVPKSDVFFSAQGPASAGIDIEDESWKDAAIRKMQDKFRRLKIVQDSIKEQGGVVDESNDAYLAEELFHGKAENDLRIMRDKHVDPMTKKMAEYGISQEMLDDYLYAMHAPERNAHIASINDRLPDGGSGMTDIEAGKILAKFRQDGRLQQLEEVASFVYTMLQTQRDMIRNGQLEDDGTVSAWEGKYAHYVPLKGWADDTKDQGRPGTGQGFSIRGKESRRSAGRRSLAASPSSFAITDLTEKIIRVRKNEVALTMLKLIEDNPDPDLWEVFTQENPDKKEVFDSRTGKVEIRPVPMDNNPDYFQAKRDGKAVYMKIKDEKLMRAMKNLGPESIGPVLRATAAYNRFLSSVNTSYSPEFMISNMLRDVQTAILNLQAEKSLGDKGKLDGNEITAATLRDLPNAMRGIYASLRGSTAKGKGAKEMQKWFEEFRAAGAKTGYFDMKDIDGQAAHIEKLVRMADGSVGGAVEARWEDTKQLVEDMNQSVENAIRLSAYVQARRAGVSEKKAASLVKNMTVNFNRRGEVGTLLNSLFMFSNASIQGVSNFVRTMGTLKGDGKLNYRNLNNSQKIAVGLVAGAYALAMANRLLSGEDDDGEKWFDKVPAYERERNIIIMKALFGGPDDGSYWKIPLPYGYNVFSVIGNSLEGAVSGARPVGSQVAETVLAIVGSFSPIGFTQGSTVENTMMKNATPTALKPLVDLTMNENFMGSTIYSENFPGAVPTPESHMGRRSTPAPYGMLAKWANEFTGGSEYRSGAIDVNPDKLAYMVDFTLGSAGVFALDKVPETVMDAITGTERPASQIPFVRRVTGQVRGYGDTDNYYKRRDEVRQIVEEMKSIRDPDERADFMRKFGDKSRLGGILKATDRQLKIQRQIRDRIYADDSLGRAEKKAKLKEVEDKMETIVDRFHAKYFEADK
jgi:hypothetical protein